MFKRILFILKYIQSYCLWEKVHVSNWITSAEQRIKDSFYTNEKNTI